MPSLAQVEKTKNDALKREWHVTKLESAITLLCGRLTEATTAAATETSFQNKHLREVKRFAIISG